MLAAFTADLLVLCIVWGENRDLFCSSLSDDIAMAVESNNNILIIIVILLTHLKKEFHNVSLCNFIVPLNQYSLFGESRLQINKFIAERNDALIYSCVLCLKFVYKSTACLCFTRMYF